MSISIRRWSMYYYVCQCRWIWGSGRLAWSIGRRPHGAHATFVKWTGWTLAVAVPWWQHHKHCPSLLLQCWKIK